LCVPYPQQKVKMKLVKPNFKLRIQYLEMLEDWKNSNDELTPFSLEYETSDFKKFIEMNENFELNPEDGFVCHSTFWLVNEDGEIVGTSNIRHNLTDKLLIKGGHIGYGIRPSPRRKGYANKILELSLIEAKKIGVEKALLTCDKDNIGSSKVILKNGGIFRKEQVVDGKLSLSFWIEIK